MSEQAGPIEILGQPQATRRLNAALDNPVPAYLFVGPTGVGKRAAAAQFAGALMASADPSGAERHRRLAVAERHPDLLVFERAGQTITAEQAREVVRVSATSPIDAPLKVIVLVDFHLVGDQTAMVLKAIEEPPATTRFVILATEIPPELVTIASRCVEIAFGPVPRDVIIAELLDIGIDQAGAEACAEAAGGDLERARLLASDPDLVVRLDTWVEIAGSLNGAGNPAATGVERLLALVDGAAAQVKARHEADLDELARRVEQTGERGSGRKDLEARHRRELRRHRTDEFRAGMARLGAFYRDELLAGRMAPDEMAAACGAVSEASQALARNPNERLLLQDLFCRLPQLG